MKMIMFFSLLLLAQLELSIAKKVVCYYTNWSYYRRGIAKFAPENIDPYLCTHILYAFSVVENNKLKVFDSNLDLNLEFMKKVADVRKRNPSVKVMLAVGGWNAGSVPFSNMARSLSTRRMFIDSVVQFMNRFDYDGLDLDWEYPAKRGGKREDKKNFSLLIKEIQHRFKQIARLKRKPKMLLSAAVSPTPATTSVSYDIPTICRELDFVNLMNYDIHGAWESKTGYLSPLYATSGEANPQNMLDTMTRNWIRAGCPREKLIFGIPMYGRGWTLSTRRSHRVGAPGNPGKPGPFVQESGMLSYAEICRKLSGSWKESFDSVAMQAIAVGGNQWYSYDNERSVAAKVNYIKSMRLGGAMIWTLDFDDFSGKACGRGRYPLLSIISKGMKGGRVTDSRSRKKFPPQKVKSSKTNNSKSRKRISYSRERKRMKASPRASYSSTRRISNCRPQCKSSRLSFRKDRCGRRRFYMCYKRVAYRLTRRFLQFFL